MRLLVAGILVISIKLTSYKTLQVRCTTRIDLPLRTELGGSVHLPSVVLQRDKNYEIFCFAFKNNHQIYIFSYIFIICKRIQSGKRQICCFCFCGTINYLQLHKQRADKRNRIKSTLKLKVAFLTTATAVYICSAVSFSFCLLLRRVRETKGAWRKKCGRKA